MKNRVYKLMGASLAMALVVASPAATMDAKAWGFNEDAHDDTDYGERPAELDNLDWSNNPYDNSSNDNSSDYSEPEYSEPTVEYTAPSETESGASYSEVSSGNNGTSGTAVAATGNTAKKTANNVTVSVAGGQKFRVVMNAVHTSCQVYHCGINKVTFTATDADGNAVAYNTVALEQGEDGLWYLNMTFAEGVDTTKLTVTADGDASYLSATLGVSGIKINGTVALSTVPATDTK